MEWPSPLDRACNCVCVSVTYLSVFLYFCGIFFAYFACRTYDDVLIVRGVRFLLLRPTLTRLAFRFAWRN